MKNWTFNSEGDPIEVFWHPIFWSDNMEAEIASLREQRRRAASDREEVAAQQKICADRDGARWCSGEVKRHQRHEKACTLALAWMEGAPNASPPVAWPKGLFEELDIVLGGAMLAD